MSPARGIGGSARLQVLGALMSPCRRGTWSVPTDGGDDRADGTPLASHAGQQQ
jgi:hypothetical protein